MTVQLSPFFSPKMSLRVRFCHLPVQTDQLSIDSRRRDGVKRVEDGRAASTVPPGARGPGLILLTFDFKALASECAKRLLVPLLAFICWIWFLLGELRGNSCQYPLSWSATVQRTGSHSVNKRETLTAPPPEPAATGPGPGLWESNKVRWDVFASIVFY